MNTPRSGLTDWAGRRPDRTPKFHLDPRRRDAQRIHGDAIGGGEQDIEAQCVNSVPRATAQPTSIGLIAQM
jgi:hypothetical protein